MPTDIYFACERGNTEKVKWLIRAGHDIFNKEDNDGWAPIHDAASNGQVTQM